MSDIWLTADLHVYHKNIIKYCNRPFKSVEEMNETIIENHNKLVKSNDVVYNLGDFCFAGFKEAESVFNRLNGQKILIEGNHDSDSCKKLKWSWIKNYYELKTDKAKLVLFHYPMDSWNGAYHGSIHCYGHVHHQLPNRGLRRIDVGIDGVGYNYSPLNLDQILSMVPNLQHTEKDQKVM
jgi:calcineurin-like phosphoesterase family protein